MRESQTLLVLAEADDELRTYLTTNLRDDGYDVVQAQSLSHVNLRLALGLGVLVLGELGPPAELLDLIRDIREARIPVPVDAVLPIVTLGPAGDELAELRALRAGADDHIEKPVRYALLLERLHALERRCRWRGSGQTLRIGKLELVPEARSARIGEQLVRLTSREFDLLARLASEPTRVFTKHELLRDVWGFRSPGRTRTVDSHACRLRRALADAGGVYVANVWGVGYRLLPLAAAGEDNGSAA